MAIRTTSELVIGVLGFNYDTLNAPDLTPYMTTASAIIDQVVTCATNKGIVITSGTLELMERWLSGFYYTKMDPLYIAKTTGSASGTFARDSKNPGDTYKDTAIDLDPSGCLNAILSRQRASVSWLGKPRSSQRTWQGRN